MKSSAVVLNGGFRPIVLTIKFETAREAADFIAHNKDEYPGMCGEIDNPYRALTKEEEKMGFILPYIK